MYDLNHTLEEQYPCRFKPKPPWKGVKGGPVRLIQVFCGHKTECRETLATFDIGGGLPHLSIFLPLMHQNPDTGIWELSERGTRALRSGLQPRPRRRHFILPDIYYEEPRYMDARVRFPCGIRCPNCGKITRVDLPHGSILVADEKDAEWFSRMPEGVVSWQYQTRNLRSPRS